MAYGLKRFVHLGFNPRGVLGIVPHNAIEGYLNKVAADWFRYGRQNYVVWTDADLVELTQGITRLPGLAKFYVFASEVAEYNGMMSPHFWTWLNKPRLPY